METVAAKRARRRKQEGAPRGVKVLAMLLMPLLVAIVVACGEQPAATREPYTGTIEGKPPGLGAPVPDPKEVLETKPVGQMPDFLVNFDSPRADKIRTQYQGAIDHYDAYSHIPCYCGCAIYTTSHRSLAQCFIKEKTDSELTFTDHSTSCDLCQTAAQMTLDGPAQNTPLKDIRAAIFDKLDYTGIWTDTPPVP